MEEKIKLMDTWMKTVTAGMQYFPKESGFAIQTMDEMAQNEVKEQDEAKEEKQGYSDDSVSNGIDISNVPMILDNFETDENGNVYLSDSGITVNVPQLIDGYSKIKIDPIQHDYVSDGYYPNMNSPSHKDTLNRDAIDTVVHHPVHEQELRGFDHLSCNLLDGFVLGWMNKMGLDPFMESIAAEDELGKQMQEQLLTELWDLNDNGDGTSAIREIFLKYAKFRLIENAKAWLKNNSEGE